MRCLTIQMMEHDRLPLPLCEHFGRGKAATLLAWVEMGFERRFKAHVEVVWQDWYSPGVGRDDRDWDCLPLPLCFRGWRSPLRSACCLAAHSIGRPTGQSRSGGSAARSQPLGESWAAGERSVERARKVGA